MKSDPEKGYSTRRKALELGGWPLLFMSFQTLGVVYSDLSTSPLYTFNGIWPTNGPPPSEEDVIGGISTMLWALTMVPLFKYAVVALQFGTDEGEGGPFAVFQTLFPPDTKSDDDDRALTGDSAIMRALSTRSSAEKLAGIRWLLLGWSLFGTAMTMADGVMTPAVSVTSAVAGIAVAKPSVLSDTTVISIAFLIFLFGIQRFGTNTLSIFYAPIALIWLLLIGATGIYNITTHPGILRAFDPSRMVMWFVRTKKYDYLAGIVLGLTGSEAMFANMGQFTKRSIQIGFGSMVYPMLILAYLGQGARLIEDGPNVIPNIFYNTIPGPKGGALYWIVFIVAILATLVASQSIITASFSLVQQVVNLKSLPKLRMVHTSETYQGQVYFPVVNYTLAAVTIAVVGGFQNLENLSNAFGFAVASVMFVTTSLMAFQIYYTRHYPWFVAIGFLLIFGFFDGLFFGATLKKVPHGAWVTLMIGCILALFMFFWTWGKGLEDAFDGRNRRNLRHFIGVEPSEQREKQVQHRLNTLRNKEGTTATLTYVGGSTMRSQSGTFDDDEVDEVEESKALTPICVPENLYLVSDDEKHRRLPLPRLPTCAVFHKLSAGRGVPHTFYGLLRKWPSLPRIVIFLSVRNVNINHVPEEDRYNVTRVRTVPGFYGVTYVVGFRDQFTLDVNDIVDKICTLESRVRANEDGDPSEVIKEIREAVEDVTHIIPHYHVLSAPSGHSGFLWKIRDWFRAFLLEEFYRRISTMFPETGNWVGSAEDIVRVGINAEI